MRIRQGRFLPYLAAALLCALLLHCAPLTGPPGSALAQRPPVAGLHPPAPPPPDLSSIFQRVRPPVSSWPSIQDTAFTPLSRPLCYTVIGSAVALLLLSCWLWVLRRQVQVRTRELHTSLGNYRELFENAGMGIFLGDAQPRIVDANPRASAITGFTREELCSFHAREIIHPDYADFNSLEDVTTRSLNQGLVVFERYYRTKAGPPVAVEVNLFVSPETKCHTVMFQDITERKQAEAALRESEESFRRLVEDLGDRFCLFRHTMDGTLTYASPSAFPLLGVSPDAVIGAPWKTVLDWAPGTVQTVQAQLARLLSGDQSHTTFELQYTHADGALRTIEVTDHVLADKDGDAVGIEGIIVDITERKHAEAAHRESEARLARIVEHSPVGISLMSLDYCYLQANPAYCRFVGYSEEELKARTLADLTHPDDLEENLRLQEALARGEMQQIQMEKRFVHKDGTLRLGIVAVTLIASPDNGQHFFLGQVLDITESKRAEESLSSLFRAVPAGLGVSNRRVFETVNDKLCEMTGFSREEMVGHHARMLYADNTESDRVAEALFPAMREKGLGACEATMRRKDGSLFTALISHTPLDAATDPERIAFAILDITAQRESEKRFRQFFEDCADPTLLLREDQRFMDCNRAAMDILGYPLKEQLIGSHPGDISPPLQPDGRPSDEKAKEMIELALNQGSQRFEWTHRSADGTDFPMEVVLTPIRMQEGRILHATLRDMTSRKQAEEALRRYHGNLEERVRQRTEELSATVEELQRRTDESDTLSRLGDLLQACETDEESYGIVASLCGRIFPRHAGFLGVFDDNTNTVRMVAGFGECDGDDLEFELNDCWALRRGGTHLVLNPEVDPICMHARGRQTAASLCIPVGAKGEFLGLLHLQWPDGQADTRASESEMEAIMTLGKRVAELYALSLSNIRLRARLHRQSVRDPLTGLYNRRHMEAALRREISRAQRKGSHMGLVLMDVDHFKQFNDTHGHDAGDAVLRHLGQLLNRQVRGADVACRYGGEELVVILPDCPPNDAMRRAEAIRSGIEALTIPYGTAELRVTASLGVASYPAHGPHGENVVTAADAALYLAKANGRNQVMAATTTPHEA